MKVGPLDKILAKPGSEDWTVVSAWPGLASTVISLAVTHMLILLEISSWLAVPTLDTTWNNDFLQHSIQGDPLRSLHDGPDVWPDDGPDPADDEDGEDDGLYDDVRHASPGGHQTPQPAVPGPLQRSLAVPGSGGDPDQDQGGQTSRLLDRQDEQSRPASAHGAARQDGQHDWGELEELAEAAGEVTAGHS